MPNAKNLRFRANNVSFVPTFSSVAPQLIPTPPPAPPPRRATKEAASAAAAQRTLPPARKQPSQRSLPEAKMRQLLDIRRREELKHKRAKIMAYILPKMVFKFGSRHKRIVRATVEALFEVRPATDIDAKDLAALDNVIREAIQKSNQMHRQPHHDGTEENMGRRAAAPSKSSSAATDAVISVSRNNQTEEDSGTEWRVIQAFQELTGDERKAKERDRTRQLKEKQKRDLDEQMVRIREARALEKEEVKAAARQMLENMRRVAEEEAQRILTLKLQRREEKQSNLAQVQEKVERRKIEQEAAQQEFERNAQYLEQRERERELHELQSRVSKNTVSFSGDGPHNFAVEEQQLQHPHQQGLGVGDPEVFDSDLDFGHPESESDLGMDCSERGVSGRNGTISQLLSGYRPQAPPATGRAMGRSPHDSMGHGRRLVMGGGLTPVERQGTTGKGTGHIPGQGKESGPGRPRGRGDMARERQILLAAENRRMAEEKKALKQMEWEQAQREGVQLRQEASAHEMRETTARALVAKKQEAYREELRTQMDERKREEERYLGMDEVEKDMNRGLLAQANSTFKINRGYFVNVPRA